MGTQYDQLALRERMEIDLWLREGLTVRAIALRLGRSASTVSRELRRNARPTKQWSGPYDGERAHVLTARRRRWDARFKLARQPDLARYVRERRCDGTILPNKSQADWRSNTVAPVISHESIYRFAYHRAGADAIIGTRLLPRAQVQARAQPGKTHRLAQPAG